MHHGIRGGTLKLSQLEVQRNPLLNHKGKGVATILICIDSGEDEEERPALPAATITPLQKVLGSRTCLINWNSFDQLELIANERRIAMEALVSIALGTRVECLMVETRVDKAFL